MNVKDSIDMLRFPDAEKAQDITGPDLAASETAKGWTKEKEEASEFESTYAEDEDEAQQRAGKGKRIRRIIAGFYLAGCIYLIILTYGVFNTPFEYAKENGLVMPVVTTAAELEKQNNYSVVLSLYLKMRKLYQEVLVLDYRVASGQEEKAVLATEYTKMDSDEVTSLYTTISAADVSSDYLQMVGIMYSWVHDTLGDYCRNMAQAITSDSEELAGEALSNRAVLEEDFRQITQNVILIGESIPSVSLEGVREWSPEGFVASSIEGIGQE